MKKNQNNKEKKKKKKKGSRSPTHGKTRIQKSSTTATSYPGGEHPHSSSNSTSAKRM
jgi:hypothetical protein